MNSQPAIRGVGKLVISGDTIVIRDRAQDGPFSTRTILLAHIFCPRVAKRPSAFAPPTSDEPFGWMAREFVRSRVIGKALYCVIQKKLNADRAFGYVYVGENDRSSNLAFLLVGKGLAQVRPNVSKSTIKRNEDIRNLIHLEKNAKAQRKGMWSTSSAGVPRHICWNIADPVAFFKRYERRPLHGVVEWVHDGSRLEIQLSPLDEDADPTYYNIMLLVSGIRAPTLRVVDNVRVEEPYYHEARFFVECRLLQRDVTIVLEDVGRGSFIGSVFHTSGNIALFLLREGLARCLRWKLFTISANAGGAKAYRNAEQEAKDKRLRMWENYVPPSGRFFSASYAI